MHSSKKTSNTLVEGWQSFQSASWKTGFYSPWNLSTPHITVVCCMHSSKIAKMEAFLVAKGLTSFCFTSFKLQWEASSFPAGLCLHFSLDLSWRGLVYLCLLEVELTVRRRTRLNGFTGRISSKLREIHLLEQYNLGSCFTLRPYKRCWSYH